MSAKKHITLKIFLFLIFTDLLETFAQFCLKKSVASANLLNIHSPGDIVTFILTVIPSPFLWVGLLSIFCIFVTWSVILSRIDLSVAVPVASFSYICIPIVSMLFLGEKISLLRWSGILLILLGVIVVSKSSMHKEEPV